MPSSGHSKKLISNHHLAVDNDVTLMSQSKQKPLKVRKREGKKKFKDNKIKVFFL